MWEEVSYGSKQRFHVQQNNAASPELSAVRRIYTPLLSPNPALTVLAQDQSC